MIEPIIQCPICGEGQLRSLGGDKPATESWRKTFMSCSYCGQCGTEDFINSIAQREKDKSRAQRESEEINEVRMEDVRRGKPGSSSRSCKRQDKPGDKLLKVRAEQEPRPLKWDPAPSTVRVELRSVSHLLRWTDEEFDLLDQLADIYQDSFSAMVRTAALWWAREAAIGKAITMPDVLPDGPYRAQRLIKWTTQEATLVDAAARQARVSFAEAVRIAVLVWVDEAGDRA